MKHKLSNVVLEPADFMNEYKEVFYRADSEGGAESLGSIVKTAGQDADNADSAIGSEGAVCANESNFACYDKGLQALRMKDTTNFFSYLNSCSLGKWKQYAGVNEVVLHLELSGDPCVVQLLGMSDGDNAPEVIATGQRLVFNEKSALAVGAGAGAGATKGAGTGSAGDAGTSSQISTRYAFDLVFPQTDKAVIGFVIDPKGETLLHEAYYYTNVAEEDVNPIKLALSTTTFKKEAFIEPNIELVKKEVFACDDPIADNFHMFVIDNGRTLDAQALSDENVSVLANPNVGGAGGFARGMMEAISSDKGFTHVLLMDDDVKICTESLKRTFNLLSLAKGCYREAFINGAMLSSEKPNLQFEDVAYVKKTGAYHRVKEDLYVDSIQDVVKNESLSVEVSQAYGAWWYSCIPVEAIKKNGLPLPLFVRCDDVEFGMRNKPIYMTMNGICVWHEAFEGRFRPSVDGYQYVRNFLIMMAMDECASPKIFLTRLERNVRMYLRIMAYNTADLFLDGFEDYLKGPEYLASVSGEELMKNNGAHNEKLLPVEELGVDKDVINCPKGVLDADKGKPLFLRLWRTLPYDRHFLPEALLRDEPKPVFYSNVNGPAPYIMGTKTLVALDLDAQNGAIRTMDKERWKAIMDRMSNLKKRYKEEGEAVRQAYKDAQPKLTSWEFWNEYLGTDLKPCE